MKVKGVYAAVVDIRGIINGIMIVKNKISKIRAVLVFFLVAAAVLGMSDALIPDSVSRHYYETEMTLGNVMEIHESQTTVEASADITAFSDATNKTGTHSGEYCTRTTAQIKLFGLIPVKNVDVNVYKNIMLYPGGMPFGVKFFTEGLLVVGMSDIDCAAYNAGIRIRDVIVSVNGEAIESAEDFVSAVESSGGNPLTIKYKRNGEEFTADVTPQISASDGKYKTGMWVRDSTAGIGTVTFVNPSNNAFAGLGHGICDADTGELMPLMRGVVVDVSISGITKGTAGAPGELKGYFSSGKTGSLIGNQNSGVYGVLLSPPQNIPENQLPIALSDEIKDGNAYIWCTLDKGSPQKYSVSISNIKKGSSDNKNFVVTVTDPALLEKTGGIVQGMSGSPIIQNGRIIGAVTHVLINDPSRGYGIFIENMLLGMPQILG